MKDSNFFSKTRGTHKSHRGIIVGFDPGLTVGLAILDLKGNLLSLGSFKEIKRSEIVSHIINYGRAVLVATDVYPHPKTVKKLASILNSKIWSPYKSMSVESKIEIVDSYFHGIYKDRIFSEVPQNAHERDALAAAIKTYRDHVKKFQQIEKRADEKQMSSEVVDTVKTMVINGVSISNALKKISEAEITETGSDYFKEAKVSKNSLTETSNLDLELQTLERLPDSGKEYENAIRRDDGIEATSHLGDVEISRLKQRLKSQERHITNLKRKNILLEEEVQGYREQVSKLKSRIDRLHHEYKSKILQKREIASKIVIIKGLQEKYLNEKSRRSELEENLKSTRGIRALEKSKKAVPIKFIESFTKEGIRDAYERWNINKGDVVLLKNSEGGGSHTASLIVNLGVKAVITMDKISDPAEDEFKKKMVPIIPASRVDLDSNQDYAVVNSKTLKREIKAWNEWVMDQKENEDKKKLLKMVEEYRAQRRRSPDQ